MLRNDDDYVGEDDDDDSDGPVIKGMGTVPDFPMCKW